MPDPKKETVRIVLPTHRAVPPPPAEGSETAMINLPTKPVVPGGVVPPAPPLTIPSIKPPAAAAEAPKIPAAPDLPKAPGVVPLAPAAPVVAIKPPAAVSEAPQVPAAPALPKAPESPAPDASVTDALLKKVTAKISLPAATRTVPQATMNLKKAAPAAAAPTEKKSTPAEADAANVAEGKAANSDLMLGIAATVVSLASLGIQVWTMLG